MNWQHTATLSEARDRLHRRSGGRKDGRRICGSLGTVLTIAALAFVPAGTAQAQPQCEAGETPVTFEAGDIYPYTVPAGVEALRITAAGGKGGDSVDPGGDPFSVGGPGAVLTGTIAVTEGQELRVLVGTAGGDSSDGGGGGGSSFVGVVPGGTENENDAFSAAHLLVVAGGGGGSESVDAGGAGGTPDGADGGGSEPGGGGRGDGTGGTPGPWAGEGGGATIGDDGQDGATGVVLPGNTGGAGAGGDGGNSVGMDGATSFGGQAAVHAGAGGTGGGADGGFGGGGSHGTSNSGGGGGGGYAGGGGGGFSGGGGGSSFFAGAVFDRLPMEATNEGNGYVIFCEIPAPAPELAFDQPSLGFGDVVVGTTSPPQTATLQNTGKAPATNLTFSTSDNAFDIAAEGCGETIAPDASCEVEVTFTLSEPGQVTATLMVETDESGEEPAVSLELTGTGVAPPTWTISGTITDQTDGALAGVTVTLTGGPGTAQTTTDDQGRYALPDLPAGEDYTVTPSLGGYTFTPPSQSFEDLGADATADFAATTVPLTVTGRVVDEEDTPLAGVTVTLSGTDQAEVITADDGVFVFEELTWGGSYIVTPTHPDYDVQPASRSFNPLEADQEVSFTATPLTATYTRYFGEGAIGAFFDTTFALFNPSEEDASATLTFAGETGEVVPHNVTIPAGTQVIVNPETLLPAEWVGFATAIEADQTLVTSRTMRWDDRHYGRHESAGVATPQTAWWFTEGATGTFQLFHLLYNPGDEAAEITATYYRGAEQATVTRTYTVGPHTRRTVFVNVAADGVTPDPDLGATEVAAHIVSTNGVPIVAERAMYLTTDAAQPLTAGTLAPGVTEPAASWHFAEGATDFFDLFLLLTNPSTERVEATTRYLLPTGEPIERTYTLEPESRRTIWVDNEDAALAETQVAISIQSETPILAERAMWWGANGAWDGGHVSTGATRPATRWGLAGLTLGGPNTAEAYVLIANPNADVAEATLTLVTPDGARAPVTMPLGPWNRTTLRLVELFPDAGTEPVALLVESTSGDNPVPLVVEGAAYASPDGQPLTTGSATPALPLLESPQDNHSLKERQ